MTVERGEDVHDETIGPATLDRASVRVALARDVANGRPTGTHVLADPDVIRAYDYVIESTEEIETALGEVTAHRIRQRRDGSSRHTLTWLAPVDAGGAVVTYDTIVSTAADDFVGQASCAETGDSDTEAIDASPIAPGTIRHFLIRAVNACGDGIVGESSTGGPRAARSCP